MPKRALRKHILERRNLLTEEVRISLSLRIQERLLAHRIMATAGTVALYSAVRNEVLTDLLCDECFHAGKKVAFPYTAADGSVGFRYVASSADMVTGKFGILEPHPDCRQMMPENADLIVVPGVAFDLAGRRLGYGKGCYDRTVHVLEGQGKLVGLAFSFQLLDELPSEPHDVVMDFIVTEDAVTPTNLNRR